MKRYCNVLSALVTILAGVAGSPYHATAQSKPDGAQAVRRLLLRAESEAPNFNQLTQVTNMEEFRRLSPPSSVVGRMLYAVKVYELRRSDGEIAVLKSLPRSSVEMEVFYEFTNQPAHAGLSPLYRRYYEAAFQSAADHPEFLHALFSIATQFDTKLWQNYDDIDWSW